MMSYDLRSDIEEMFFGESNPRRVAKRRLNEFYDKFGESRMAIENLATDEEYSEYLMLSGYENEVLRERREARMAAAKEKSLLQRDTAQEMRDDMAQRKEKNEESDLQEAEEHLERIEEAGKKAVDAYKNLDREKIKEDTDKYVNQTEQEQNELMNSLIKKFKIDMEKYGKGFSKEYIRNMLNDTRFQNAMDMYVRPNEGGKAHHENDRGGLTNFGISSKYYPSEDIDNLTPQRASVLLYRDYWLKTKIYLLPDELVGIVFDDAVVQGQPAAVMNLQKALGVKADGKIGPKTLDALVEADLKNVKKKFIQNVHKREDLYLKNDSSQRVFEKGHRKRFNKYY